MRYVLTTTYISTLKESATSFPPEFASFKVLPSLTSALEFGGASAATILPLILQIGASTSPENYTEVIIGPVIKLFASTDRSTRMTLLEHLPEYIENLDQKIVSDKIFPHLASSPTLPQRGESDVGTALANWLFGHGGGNSRSNH